MVSPVYNVETWIDNNDGGWDHDFESRLENLNLNGFQYYHLKYHL